MVGCASSPPTALESKVGQQLYTQVSFWTYKNQHDTVNYGVDRHIPINTPVTIVDISAKTVEFTLSDGGAERVLINTEKYTNKTMTEIFSRYFGSSKKSLQGFTRAERQAIKRGEVKKGMSKNAVLLARGYPPAHETPSTEADEWKYWKSRFNTTIVYFKNGKVSRIKH
jgi:hypothetical protein